MKNTQENVSSHRHESIRFFLHALDKLLEKTRCLPKECTGEVQGSFLWLINEFAHDCFSGLSAKQMSVTFIQESRSQLMLSSSRKVPRSLQVERFQLMGPKSLDRWGGNCGKPTFKDGWVDVRRQGGKGGDRGRKVQVSPTYMSQWLSLEPEVSVPEQNGLLE